MRVRFNRLLAFTFSMAANRYEARRDLVIQEANAIGATYLRAALLPEAQQAATEQLLRRYVAARLDFYDKGASQTEVRAAEQSAAQIQRELWSLAVTAGKAAPTPLAAIYVQALNEMIDLDATRLNALRNHVPGAVWILVLLVASFGCCLCGYQAGSSGARGGFNNLVLPLLIAIVINLIADLDHPRGGLILINQQPLIDIKQTLQASQPGG